MRWYARDFGNQVFFASLGADVAHHLDGEDQLRVSERWFVAPSWPDAEGVPGDPYGLVCGALAGSESAAPVLEWAMTETVVAVPFRNPPTVWPGVIGPDWPVDAE